MKTKAVRIYGKENLIMEEFELPVGNCREILVKIVLNISKVYNL